MKNEFTAWYVASVAAPINRYNPINGHGYQGWVPCIEWCEKTFGDITMDNYRWRFISEGVFEFREESDLIAFLLKWSQ
jgi:hypothetical protein